MLPTCSFIAVSSRSYMATCSFDRWVYVWFDVTPGMLHVLCRMWLGMTHFLYLKNVFTTSLKYIQRSWVYGEFTCICINSFLCTVMVCLNLLNAHVKVLYNHSENSYFDDHINCITHKYVSFFAGSSFGEVGRMKRYVPIPCFFWSNFFFSRS